MNEVKSDECRCLGFALVVQTQPVGYIGGSDARGLESVLWGLPARCNHKYARQRRGVASGDGSGQGHILVEKVDLKIVYR